MSTAAWDATTIKEGIIVGIRWNGGTGGRQGTTNTVWGGPIVEIVDEVGNFVCKIALDSGSATTATTYTKFSNGADITGSQYQPALGDIAKLTSTTQAVVKRQL